MAEFTAEAVSGDFRGRESNYFSTRQDYSSVHAILLYWRDHDIEGLEKEVEAFRELLEEFQYDVTTWPIPTDGAQQQKLNCEIASLLLKARQNGLRQ
jgi:hypothetical protein